MRHWGCAALGAAVRRWLEATAVRRLARHLATIAVQHWRGATVAMAWRAWRQAPVLNALANRAGQGITRSSTSPMLPQLES